MKAIATSLLLFKLVFSERAEVFTCTSEPCYIKPINSPKRASYVVLTNDFDDCTVDCREGNCAKTNGPLIVYSGCNNTQIECDDNCEGLYGKIGELGDIIIDENYNWKYNSFNGRKKSATITCKSCKKGNFRFVGEFKYGVNVFGSGVNGLAETDIDCEDAIGFCNVNCEPDEAGKSCLKDVLSCNSDASDEDCGCVGDCDGETVEVRKQNNKAASSCGLVTPSGEAIIATNDCDELTVDCSTGNCGSSNYDKSFSIISGAKRTTVLCGGLAKNCEFMKIRAGDIEDEDIPKGYYASDFYGNKINFRAECNSQLACPYGDIRVIGSYSEYVSINAIGLDAYQNGKLYCDVRDGAGDCELTCHFSGCDGSMFDCNLGYNDEGCECVNDAGERRLQGDATPDVTGDTTVSVTEAIEGPTCPPINMGRPYEPGMVDTTTPATTSTTSTTSKPFTTTTVKVITTPAPIEPPETTSTERVTAGTIAQAQTEAQTEAPVIDNGGATGAVGPRKGINQVQQETPLSNVPKSGSKVAAIIVLFLLAATIGGLYYLIYKTRYCRTLKRYENALNNGKYNTFQEYEMTNAGSYA